MKNFTKNIDKQSEYFNHKYPFIYTKDSNKGDCHIVNKTT